MTPLRESTVSGRALARLSGAMMGQGRKTQRCPDTPRLDGKRVLITGATNGIGLEMARGVLARGADLVLPCRNADKGKRVLERLRAEGGAKARIDLVPMDLSDLRSVRGAAEQIVGLAARIDVLIENAGVWERSFALNPQGHEITFATNVLGHFALRQRLLDAGLLPRARVVIVTGDIYVLQSACTPEFAWRGPIGGMKAYCRSKLGNLWIAAELQKRHPELSVFVVHPGAIDTDLGGKATGISAWFKRTIMIDAELGAQTALICATQEGLRRGGYYHNAYGLMRLPERDPALDQAAAAALWSTCERLAAA